MQTSQKTHCAHGHNLDEAGRYFRRNIVECKQCIRERARIKREKLRGGAPPPCPPSVLDRFWANVEKQDDCWIWTGDKAYFGYGRLRVGGKQETAHRFSYQLHNGDIPIGKVVMHACDVPACVNPAHLSLGTQAENMADCARKGRIVNPRAGIYATHCKKGHELTEDNVYVSNGVSSKQCKICAKQRASERYQTLKNKKSLA